MRAIFWDNDGVLVDTEHLYMEATQQVLQSVGILLTQEQYVEWFLVQGKGAWHLAEEQGVPLHEVNRLRDERNALYARWLVEAPRLICGVDGVLQALHKKYVMGVVTSSRADHFNAIHQSTNIMQYFDFVITAEDYRRAKPDPAPYLLALEKSGIGRDACIAVEDSERGLESATRAGIPCIVVPSDLTRSGKFVGAYRVLGSVGEILSVL